ncbi:MAG: hypothetical protein IBX64_05415 [Actinobacteria bacterium]|nr:hypothetical protein [Actinomycetota bacterium]
MQRKAAIIILLIFMFLSVSPQTLQAETGKKVVFILMDNITWLDIIAAKDPVLDNLLKSSSIGLMNNRAFKAPSRPRNALTVGAGVRAEASPSSLEGYNASELHGDGLAMDTYRQRTGKCAKPHHVLELGIAAIVKDNDNNMQEFTPGQLADIISGAGKKTAVLGNSDTSLVDGRGGYNREAVAIAMNSNGVVEYGDVSKSMLTHDPNYPFGIKTDYEKLKARFTEFFKKADFIVIDLGDTARADFYAKRAFKRQAHQHRMHAIHVGMRFIKEAMDIAGEDTTFIIASLSPPGSSKLPLRGSLEQMTPVLIHGLGFKAGGLISDTTRRNGLVTIIDIAPTVLSALGLEKGRSMPGSPMRSGSAHISVESLNNYNQSAIGVRNTRNVAIPAYIYIQIILYMFAALVLVFRKMLNKISFVILKTLIFTTMSFPLFSFYTTKFDHLAGRSFVVTSLTVAISLAFAIILVLVCKKALNPIVGVSVLTLTILSIDALMGGPSLINSILGYDPVRGARFFGVGNEAMSILVANTLLLFGIMLERTWNRRAVMAGLILCAAVTTIIGFPGIGANTGGTIAAVFAFVAMLLQAMRSKAKMRNIAIAIAAVVIVLGGFVVYDATHGVTTHMGKTINLIMAGGLPEITMIVKRKLAINFMILRYSTWLYFLLITLGLLAFLWFRPVGLLKRLLVNHRGISAAISASIVGGITGFVFNDSGILVPAIIMSYMIPTVVYLMLWEQYHSAG